MKFTTNEWEIILHRLEVADAIVEVLTDDNDKLDPVYIEDKIDMLEIIGPRGCVNYTSVQMLILRECCEGSTWFAGLYAALDHGDITPAKVSAYTRAANRLETKLNVSIPRA